jgi:hypothetical protein
MRIGASGDSAISSEQHSLVSFNGANSVVRGGIQWHAQCVRRTIGVPRPADDRAVRRGRFHDARTRRSSHSGSAQGARCSDHPEQRIANSFGIGIIAPQSLWSTSSELIGGFTCTNADRVKQSWPRCPEESQLPICFRTLAPTDAVYRAVTLKGKLPVALKPELARFARSDSAL